MIKTVAMPHRIFLLRNFRGFRCCRVGGRSWSQDSQEKLDIVLQDLEVATVSDNRQNQAKAPGTTVAIKAEDGHSWRNTTTNYHILEKLR